MSRAAGHSGLSWDPLKALTWPARRSQASWTTWFNPVSQAGLTTPAQLGKSHQWPLWNKSHHSGLEPCLDFLHLHRSLWLPWGETALWWQSPQTWGHQAQPQ